MNLLDVINNEWPAIKAAPRSIALLVVCTVLVSVGGARWYFSDQLRVKDDKIASYRLALGIDKASPGALVELSNEELALKAENSAGKIRSLNATLGFKLNGIRDKQIAKTITDTQAFQQTDQAMREASDEFDNNYASDVNNVDKELRKRLSPDALSHIVGVPAFITGSGERLPLITVMKGTGLDTIYLRTLADELEQMSLLLPKDN